jgi:ketosteroid isomerase-like protein
MESTGLDRRAMIADDSTTADDHLAAARDLYAAFAARDAVALLDLLHPDFVGHASAGMPLRVGGRHDGPDAMLAEVWGPVFAVYDVAPEADELLVCDDGRVVAVGAYRGAERGTGATVDAAFAHLLRFRDGKVSELVQITDTASWPAPS